MKIVSIKPLAPAPYSWTGFYLGIQGGGGWADTSRVSAVAAPHRKYGATFALRDIGLERYYNLALQTARSVGLLAGNDLIPLIASNVVE